MKASELITLLQDAIDKYGDLPIRYEDFNEHRDIDGIDIVKPEPRFDPEVQTTTSSEKYLILY